VKAFSISPVRRALASLQPSSNEGCKATASSHDGLPDDDAPRRWQVAYIRRLQGIGPVVTYGRELGDLVFTNGLFETDGRVWVLLRLVGVVVSLTMNAPPLIQSWRRRRLGVHKHR